MKAQLRKTDDEDDEKERAKEKRRQELEKKREERRKKQEKEKERQKKRGGYNLATDRLMADKVFLMNLAEGGLYIFRPSFGNGGLLIS